MQMHDRKGMHTTCFREGESPTYVLRNECVVLNQVVTVCPAIAHLGTSQPHVNCSASFGK